MKFFNLSFSKYDQSQILKNFSWLFFDRLLRISVGFIVSIWIARYLKPELFGILNYCIAFVSFFVGIAALGTPQILIRQFVSNRDELNKTLTSGFILMSIGSIISTLLCIIIIIFKANDTLTISLVIILSIRLLLMPIRVISCYFESILKSKFNVISGSIAFIIVSIIKIIALVSHQSIFVFATLIIAEVLLTAIFLIFQFLRINNVNYLFFKFKFDKQNLGLIIKDSWPLIISIVSTSLLLKVDQIMVRDMCNDYESGIYAVSVRLTEIWYFIPVIIQTSIFPSIVKSFNDESEKFLKQIKFLLTLVVFIGLAISITTFLLSGEIVRILYGNDYIESAKILKILIWATVFVGIIQIRNSFLYTNNFTIVHMKIVILSLILNVALNYLWIDDFQGAGAALSTLVTYAFSALFANFIFEETRILFWLLINSILKPFSNL